LEAYVNIKKFGEKVLLAACDAELLGKTIREADIEFEIKREFYKGYKTNVDNVVDLFEQATIINLTGCNIVNKAIERGYVHPEAVVKINCISHAQIVKI
jgi:hypothetical protein